MFLVFLPGLAPPSYERYQSARPFYAYSYDNSLARGAGPCLTLVVFSFSLFLLFKIAELLIRKVDRIREWAREHTWLKKIVYGMILRFRWHYISDTMFITYLPVLLFSVAELYNLTANHFFSHILCATLIIIYSAFPLFVGFKLLRHFPNISKGKHSANLRCFYRGIQRTNKFGVFLIIIRYLRKLIYALIIGVFSANPMYALPILMFTSVLMGLYILLNLPFEKKLSNAIEMGTEACIALVFLAIAIINFNNFSGNSTVNMVIGWVCCALLTVMILLLMMEVFLKTFFHLES